MLEQLWLGLGLAAVAWLFYDGMRVREAALVAGRDYCGNLGLQMLDETVSRQRTGLARAAGGQLALRRHFSFEFTSDGERRYRGDIVMLGLRVESVQVELHRMLH
jgi:hypothetical protein